MNITTTQPALSRWMRAGLLAIFLTGGLAPNLAAQEEHEHQHDSEEAHRDDGDSVSLAEPQRALAGIRVEVLQAKAIRYAIYAPAEIKSNGYSSYWVSARTPSIILKRHVTLGSHVEQGQPLVSLFSAEVADTQADYLVALNEWRRVEQLGRQAVGDGRYVAARSKLSALRSRLSGFGLARDAIQSLQDNPNIPLGEYVLRANIAGAVLADNFHQGQRLEAGAPIIELAQEDRLWAEARLSPADDLPLKLGQSASIQVGDKLYPAKVAQEAHTIDPLTRTRILRLEVDNSAHELHPGIFADAYFDFVSSEPILAVGASALMRDAQGDWIVFSVQAEGRFAPVKVKLIRTLGDWHQIEGIEAGTKIVSQGAFFVASELAKGGFDPHNH